MKHYTKIESGIDVYVGTNTGLLKIDDPASLDHITLGIHEVQQLRYVFANYIEEFFPEIWKRENKTPDGKTLKCGIKVMEFEHAHQGPSVALLGLNHRVAVALNSEHAPQVIDALTEWFQRIHPTEHLHWQITKGGPR